jgi:hypothetical protein
MSTVYVTVAMHSVYAAINISIVLMHTQWHC